MNRFDFLQSIDAGASGDVWRARDNQLQRDVAIKIIREESIGFGDALHHARALAKAKTPHVVDVYDVIRLPHPETGEMVDMIVMELLEGETLDCALRKNSFRNDELLGIARQITSGLAAIHDGGMFHGDFHGGNIMVHEGSARIIDLIYRTAESARSTRHREEQIRIDIRRHWDMCIELIKFANADPLDFVSRAPLGSSSLQQHVLALETVLNPPPAKLSVDSQVQSVETSISRIDLPPPSLVDHADNRSPEQLIKDGAASIDRLVREREAALAAMEMGESRAMNQAVEMSHEYRPKLLEMVEKLNDVIYSSAAEGLIGVHTPRQKSPLELPIRLAYTSHEQSIRKISLEATHVNYRIDFEGELSWVVQLKFGSIRSPSVSDGDWGVPIEHYYPMIRVLQVRGGEAKVLITLWFDQDSGVQRVAVNIVNERPFVGSRGERLNSDANRVPFENALAATVVSILTANKLGEL